MDPVVQQALLTYAQTGQARRYLWSETLLNITKHDGFLDDHASALVALAFSTLPIYFDATSQRLVKTFLQAAIAKSDVFLKTFAAALITVEPSQRSKQECFVLLRWNTLLLQQLRLPAAGKAAARLIGSQAGLLDSLVDGGPPWNRVRAVIATVLRSKPILVKDCIVVATSTGSPGMMRLIVTYLQQHDPEQLAQHQQPLLAAFAEHVIGSKVPQSNARLSAYVPLLAYVSNSQFDTLLLPAVLRMMKRSPDVALPVLAAVCRYVHLNLSQFSTALVEALAPNFRSPKAPTREAALRVVTAIGPNIASPGAISAAADTLLSIVEGNTSAGKLKVVSDRATTLTAVRLLAEARDKGQAAKDSASGVEVLPRLCTIYKSDSSEEVKIAAAAAIGAWTSTARELVQPVIQHFAAGLTDKEALRRANLRALAQGLQPDAPTAEKGAPLTAVLISILKEGIAKVTSRSDAVIALYCLTVLAAHSSAANEQCRQEKVWKAALGSGSPLLQAPAIGRLPDTDATHVAPAVKSLLLHQGGHLDDSATATAYQAMVLAALLPAAAARRSALDSMKGLVTQAPQSAAALVAAVRMWLRQPFSGPTYVDGAEDGAVSRAVVGRRFLAILEACAPREPANMPPQLIAQLSMATSHPVVKAAQARRPPWTTLQRVLPAVPEIIQEDPTAVIDALLADDAWGSDEAAEQLAALGALQHLMAAAPDALYPPLLVRLRAQLDTSAHDQLTTLDLAKWRTPEGVLAADLAVQVGFQAQQADSKNIRKARGRHKMDYYSDSDEEGPPAPMANGTKPRPGHSRAAAKPSTGGKKDPAAERKAQLLREEAEVRDHVTAIKCQLDRGLTLLRAAVAGDHVFTADHVDSLAPPAAPLLGSELVGEGAAWEAVAEMAASLPGPLGATSRDVATALRLVVLQQTTGVPNDKQFAAHQAVKRSFAALGEATSGSRPLEGPAWAFVFPMVQALLAGDAHTKLHDSALAVLSLHVAPGTELPRGAMLRLLYRLLQSAPAYRDCVQPLLADLCAGCSEADLPAALEGLLAASAHVRAAALAALEGVPVLTSGQCPDDPRITTILWMTKYDASPANVEAAENLWEEAGAQLSQQFVPVLTPLLGHRHEDIRSAAADALAAAIEEQPGMTEAALAAVTTGYADSGVNARSGTAQALRAIAPLLQQPQVEPALEFLLSVGLADPDPNIRELMVSAGVALVDSHGSSQSAPMMTLFDRYLDGSSAVSGVDEATFDRVREGVVVLLGTLARHMTSQDDKVRSIVEMLLDMLTTPSQAVQRAVSGCLPPLMTGQLAEAAYVSGLIQRLLTMLQSPSYGDRRGGAYGIAGIVKGLGISALRGHGIMDALKAAIENKKDSNAREGSLFAFEALVDKLGRLFEPYVIQILPMLLACFGDSDAGVREASDAASRTIMSHLSGHGVKLVLPSLLTGLEDRQWRTKQGSIQMLGAMAYCAPKQLSTALPTIVPRLSAVLSDPHPKVQTAARTALNEVGSVIRNPEVSVLVPVLLSAIADAAKHTRPTLEVLLDTVFINTIDAASLALIVPVVARGLRDRSGDAKRKAARIVGNMCALINEPKDMAPYVSLLMPELQAAVVDPLPEVRATSARALGSLLRGMGADHFTELVPWLLTTLRSEGSGVERSGAAQGLAEVLAVLGPEYLTGLLPDILASCAAPRHFEREGNLTLFKFLPLAMEEDVQEHLEAILPCVLGGLADEAEGVRAAALAAGRTVVDLYSLSALQLLLPAILTGTAHGNWRIRQSSIELLGDLLFKVAGTSGKVRLDGNDDEEGASTEAQGAAILGALGYTRRNEVLSRIFMARSDVGYSVRTAAVHVWKTVVSNTPRTTTEILPVLMAQIIEALSCAEEERQQMAAGCLGELVRKMGERVLQKIIPILQEGICSSEAATRQGVCTGIQEVLQNVTRQQLADMLPTMLPTIQTALCDEDEAVRTAAGGAFGILFRGGAGGAVDTVIPSLLTGLAGPEPGQALAGLRVILGVRPMAINSMLPKLLKPPLSAADVTALGSLSEVAGPAVHGHLSAIMPPLLELCSAPPDAADTREQAAREALLRVIATVTEDGAYLLVAEIVKALEEPVRRRGAADAAARLCSAAKYDMQDHLTSILTALLPLLMVTDEEVLLAVWTAIGAATAAVPKEFAPSYVRTLKEGVATAVERQRRKRLPGPLLLPGLCLPKALTPLLPIYLQGVLQGSSAELREMAAQGLGDLVKATGDATLKPFVIQITGPLIRIIGDRFASSVKGAILETLAALLDKAGPALKPFLPQLQTTFLKCLADPARQVRRQAGENLGQLAALSPRVDQLAGDQLASSLHSAEPALKEGYAAALRGLLHNAGARLSPPVVARLGSSLAAMLPNAGDDEAVIAELAGCLGEWAVYAALADVAASLAAGPLSDAVLADWHERLGRALTLAATIRGALPRLEELQLVSQTEAAIIQYARDDSIPVKVAAATAMADLVTCQLSRATNGAGSDSLAVFVPPLVGLLGLDQASEVVRAGMQALRRIAATSPDVLTPYLGELLPLVAATAASGAGPTRVAAEHTMAAALQLSSSMDFAHDWLATARPGATVRQYLTEATLRRLSRLQLQIDDGLLL